MFFSGAFGLLLSLVCGFLVLALVAELCYLLWWRKEKLSHTRIEPSYSARITETDIHDHLDIESGSAKAVLLQSCGEDSMDSEIMRLHSLFGPPRFLFTINEETKEDLESDDGKSKGDWSRKGSRARSLSDIVLTIETPFLSPLPSPPLKVSTAALANLDPYDHKGLNSLIEPSMELELSMSRSSSPPKFKFLRDAEEKLHRRLLEETEYEKNKAGDDNEHQYLEIGRPQNSSTL
ncbi:hypothetical protein Droror1_Dr00019085 [Drosera rotundifolia]